MADVRHDPLETLTPEARSALEVLGHRLLAQERPLCPRCVAREVNTQGEWCAVCDDELDAQRSESERAAKRKWWRNHGADQRREKGR